MNSKKLDLTPLKNALDRLVDGNNLYLQDIADTQIRDGLIQRYEFTYEISHKILTRYMEINYANPEMYDSMQFSELIRSGNDQSLLKAIGLIANYSEKCALKVVIPMMKR